LPKKTEKKEIEKKEIEKKEIEKKEIEKKEIEKKEIEKKEIEKKETEKKKTEEKKENKSEKLKALRTLLSKIKSLKDQKGVNFCLISLSNLFRFLFFQGLQTGGRRHPYLPVN